MDFRILVIEDDKTLLKLIENSLLDSGYFVTASSSGRDGLSHIRISYYDLIVTDLDLGDINGQEIISNIRKNENDIPIIVISTTNNIDSKIELFKTGCDDYITKPFFIDEFLVRVKRILKRSAVNNSVINNREHSKIYSIGDLTIDAGNFKIMKNNEALDVTRKVFDMLVYFIENSNQLITKDQLISKFWEESGVSDFNCLNVHIFKIRSIIEVSPKSPKLLKTVRGQGYIFSM